MLTTRTEGQRCRNCGYHLNAHSSVESDIAPAAGYLSVCIGCGSISVFEDDLNLRPMTTPELTDLMNNHLSTYMHIKGIQAMIKIRIKKN